MKDLNGITYAGNAGLVATTGGGAADLLHTHVTDRSTRLWKIMAYNNTGGNATLQFGTLTGAAVFVALMPIFVAINGFDNEWEPLEIPDVEWKLNTSAGAAGRTGDIYVIGSVAGVVVQITVLEIRTNPHF